MIGWRPCDLNHWARLAVRVVLPEPWSPAMSTTVGGLGEYVMRIVSPPRVAVSSSLTILMTCCAGLSAFDSSSPTHRSRMRATRFLTTWKLTSASSRARRISRRTSSTSASLSRPRPRSLVKMPSKRSESASNMEDRGYRTSTAGRQAGPVTGIGGRIGAGAHHHQVVDRGHAGDGGGDPGQLVTRGLVVDVDR